MLHLELFELKLSINPFLVDLLVCQGAKALILQGLLPDYIAGRSIFL